MRGMFWGAYNFNQPLNNWNISNVKYMDLIFHNLESFDKNNALWYDFER